MKWVVVFLGIGAGWLLLNWEKNSEQVPAVLPEMVMDRGSKVEVDGKSFDYLMIKEQNLEAGLVPNYENKLTTSEILEKHGCRAGINGGFYGEDGKPLGLVVIDGNEYNPRQKNALLNGFLWVNKGNWGIGRIVPEKISHGVQTGPVIVENGQEVEFELVRDKEARRSVAMIDTAGRIYFSQIYLNSSVLDGPRLADLAETVIAIALKENLTLSSAINLDGGAASSIVTSGGEKQLEWANVGSFWCLK